MITIDDVFIVDTVTSVTDASSQSTSDDEFSDLAVFPEVFCSSTTVFCDLSRSSSWSYVISALFSITPAKQVVGVECTVRVGFRTATMMSFPVTYE